ncbi:MAG TPA: Crp/Fnr family transcriptional regulator [Pyrinomonadaceae bacterium]|nr:Crp/Fnr family transcriptional regulator [Pyrinomonadaceae bacterium]
MILSNFSDKIRQALLDAGHNRTYSANAEVFAKGENADFLPVVVAGRIKMVRYPEPGKEIIIGTFGPGEVFAIPPALDGKQFPATAIAMEDSRLLLIPRDKFLSLKDSLPEFSQMIIDRMCGLLRERTDTTEIFATSSAEQRVVATLLRIADEIPDGTVKRITHRRQDIAEMSGLTIESTIRVIRRLASIGLFEIVHGKIHIAETEPLKRFLR